LDVSGSFHVSTADFLRFADGAAFATHLGGKSTLTVAAPAAFGFLGSTPAPITIQGSALQVSAGKTLSVVGGDMQIVGGQLVAPGGRIQLASVASPGEVSFSPLELAPELQVDSFTRLGQLELSRGGRLDVSPLDVNGNGIGSGTVLLRGGRLTVASAGIGAVTGNRDGAKMGIDLRLADDVVVDNSTIATSSTGHGNTGELRAKAGALTLRGGAIIGSLASGSGKGGNITVAARESVSISGHNAQGVASGIVTVAAAEPGRLSLSAPSVTIDGGVVGTPSLATGGFVAGRGGETVVKADNLTLSGSGGIASVTNTDSKGGNITIETGRLTISDGAKITSSTFGSGQGGNLTVVARDTLTLAGASSGLFARAEGGSSGNAGALRVEAGTLTLSGGAQISSSTFGAGQGGTVTVMARDTLTLAGESSQGNPSGLFASAERGSSGNAGALRVEAGTLTLSGGAQIGSSTRGPGQGGTIRITAADTLTLSGTSPDGLVSGIFATALGMGVGAGDAGAVIVEARTARIAEGAQISSSTFGPGQGGTVTVTTADTLTIAGRNSGLRTTAAGRGGGGDITVDARQVQLTDGAVITAASTGAGNAGSLLLTAHDTLLLRGHSAVKTEASQATGGNIRVTAPSLVRLQDSQLSATVGGGAGDGGNVTIDPAFIVLQGSQITANAFAGHGGRISLTASKAFLADPESTVTASSTLGINGEVNIQAPVTNISGAVAPLKQAFAPTTELLRSRCAARLREGTVSRFIISGRDGVPLEPGSLLLSPLVREEQPSLAPLAEPVAGQREVSFGPEGGLERPTIEALSVRGTQAQARGPGALDVECVRWRGRQGIDVHTVP
jgi:large exoprotein involved in heme utilization and adhesion